jgi:hypothetical protein
VEIASVAGAKNLGGGKGQEEFLVDFSAIAGSL